MLAHCAEAGSVADRLKAGIVSELAEPPQSITVGA